MRARKITAVAGFPNRSPSGVWRSLRGLLVCASTLLLWTGVTACGSAHKDPAATPAHIQLDEDGDIDSRGQGGRYDTDNDATLTWGPTASAATRKAVLAVIKRYYELAKAGDGAAACTTLDPLMVEMIVEARSGGGEAKSPPGSTCTQIMSSYFRERHRQLVEDLASFRPIVVQQHGNRALALMNFAANRQWQVLVRRKHGVWQMDTPLYVGVE